MRSMGCDFGSVLGRSAHKEPPARGCPPCLATGSKAVHYTMSSPVTLVPRGFRGFSVPLVGLHFEGGRQILEFVPPLLDRGGLAGLSDGREFGVNFSRSPFEDLSPTRCANTDHVGFLFSKACLVCPGGFSTRENIETGHAGLIPL